MNKKIYNTTTSSVSCTPDKYSVAKLVLISGPPGAGKSTLAVALAEKLNATHLDKDCIDDPFAGNDRGPAYSTQIEPKVLEALLNLAKLNLRKNHWVILDVPWTHILLNTPIWISKILELSESTKSKIFILECVLTESALRLRLETRGLKRDEPKLSPQGWENFKKIDRISEKNPLPHFVVDMEKPVEACFTQAMQVLFQEK